MLVTIVAGLLLAELMWPDITFFRLLSRGLKALLRGIILLFFSWFCFISYLGRGGNIYEN